MLPPSSFPTILPRRLLENCYDDEIPDDLSVLADAGTYEHYYQRLLMTAERRFHQRILNTLSILGSWRLRSSPWRWQKLRLYSESLQIYRHRAREAFDFLL